MKILFLGSNSPSSGTLAFTRNLQKAGAEVKVFELGSPFYLPKGNTALSSAILKPFHVLEVSLRFVRECKEWKPDFILSPKSDLIHHRAIREVLASTKSKYILWYGDNPFHASVTSMYVIESLKDCAIYYTYAKFMIDTLYSAGCRRVEYLPFGYDPEHHPFEIQLTDEERQRYQADICFVGTWDREREKTLSLIVDYNLKIYGRLWNERVPLDSPLRKCIVPGVVDKAEMSKRFHCSKIVLNMLRTFNWTSHNMRTMEATGINGGCLLTPWTTEQARELFTEDKHLFCYQSPDELASTVENLLILPEESRHRVSLDAHNHVMQHHLFEHRCAKIVHDLSSL